MIFCVKPVFSIFDLYYALHSFLIDKDRTILLFCRWNFEEGRPSANFDTFPVALLTVFQVNNVLITVKLLLNGSNNVLVIRNAEIMMYIIRIP